MTKAETGVSWNNDIEWIDYLLARVPADETLESSAVAGVPEQVCLWE
jgi:hypothetical protein